MFGGVPAPMLARLEASLPRGDHWGYEPKFDGSRGLPWRAPNGAVHLLSRSLKDLSHVVSRADMRRRCLRARRARRWRDCHRRCRGPLGAELFAEGQEWIARLLRLPELPTLIHAAVLDQADSVVRDGTSR